MSNGTYNTAGDTTLYAQWTANTYTISFNPNGGSGTPAPQTVTYGGSYTLPTATRANYTLNGWYTAASGGTKATGTYNTAGDSTLYAQWTPVTYTISFDTNGGGQAPAAMSVAYGSSYSLNQTSTRDYYTFNGWYTAKTGGTKVTGGTYQTAGNTTLYAQWTPKNVEGPVSKDIAVSKGGQITKTAYYSYTVTDYTRATTQPAGYTLVQGSQQVAGYDANNVTWSGTWTDTAITETGAVAVQTRQVETGRRYQYHRYVSTQADGKPYWSYRQDYASLYGTGTHIEYKYPSNGGARLAEIKGYTDTEGNYWKAYGSTSDLWFGEEFGIDYKTQYMAGNKAPIYSYLYAKSTGYTNQGNVPASVPGTAEVSNVVEWVYYIPK